jgi:RimJ/RimL family protein N-acetyltransferase
LSLKAGSYISRAAQRDDVEFILALHRLPHVRDVLNVPTIEQAERSIATGSAQQLIILEGEERVGMLMYAQVEPWLFEIRLMISKHPGRGIGTFAFESALERIFEQHRAHRAYLEVHASNAVARRLYEHGGFTYEGAYRHGARHAETGAFEDLCVYAMLEDEYRARKR